MLLLKSAIGYDNPSCNFEFLNVVEPSRFSIVSLCH